MVSEELDKELNSFFYTVVCSSKWAQEVVRVTRDLVWHPASPSFPAAWTMLRTRQGVGWNCIFSPPEGLNRGGTGAWGTLMSQAVSRGFNEKCERELNGGAK